MLDQARIPYRDILKKFIGYSWGPLGGALFGFVSVPVTTRMLIPEEFGRSNMYALTLTLFSLLAYLGVDQAFVREYHAYKDKKKLLANAVAIPLLLCLAIIPVALAFSRPVGLFLFGHEDFFSTLLLVVQFPLMILIRFNELVLRMRERPNTYSGMGLINKGTHFFMLLILLITFERSYKAIVFSSFLSAILIAIVYFWINRNAWTIRERMDKVLQGKLLAFGLPLLPASILAWAMSGIGQFGIRILSDYTQLGIYSGGLRIASVLLILQTVFNAMWAPMAYRWHEENVGVRRYQRLGELGFRALFLVFILLVVMKDLVVLLLGPKYAEVRSVYPFLIMVPILSIASEIVGIGISLTRKTSWMILITGLAVVFNISLNLALVPRYGAMGGAIATATGYTAYFLGRLFVSNHVWERMRISIFVFYLSAIWIFLFVTVFFSNVVMYLIGGSLFAFGLVDIIRSLGRERNVRQP